MSLGQENGLSWIWREADVFAHAHLKKHNNLTERERERERERQTDRQTGRQADRQTDRQTAHSLRTANAATADHARSLRATWLLSAPDCRPGMYGADCNSTCDRRCQGGVCNRQSGNCTVGMMLWGTTATGVAGRQPRYHW